MKVYKTSQNQQEDWRIRSEKEGMRATMDLQVTKIIHIMVRKTTERECLRHFAQTEVLGESDSQVGARGFPLAKAKLGSWLKSSTKGIH